MDNTTWYYTLSTASQTLAALLGVSAVFVILRLEGISTNINKYKLQASDILKTIDRHVNPSKNLEKESSKQLLTRLKGYQKDFPRYTDNRNKNEAIRSGVNYISQEYEPNKNSDGKAFIEVSINSLESFIDQRDDLFKMIETPAFLATCTIMYCMLLLSFTEFIPAKVFFLVVALGTTLYSIYSIIRAARKTFEAITRLE